MTLDDLERIATECVWHIHGKGTNWRYLNEKDMRRAKLVLVDGMRQCDVVRNEGVSSESVSKAVRRAKRGARKIGLMANLK